MSASPSQTASQANGRTRPARAASTAAGAATMARAHSSVLNVSLVTIPSSCKPTGSTAAVKRATTRARRDSGEPPFEAHPHDHQPADAPQRRQPSERAGAEPQAHAHCPISNRAAGDSWQRSA